MSKRSDFPSKLPLSHEEYCFKCGSNSVTKKVFSREEGTQVFFLCDTCNVKSDRVRIWDPKMIQFFDTNQNLVHEGAGVLIQNSADKILLFLRTKYPFQWTIPGGHMSPGENPQQAAVREIEEEVGIKLPSPRLIFEGTIIGDECMGGVDIHKWHLYHSLAIDAEVNLNDEGCKFGWFDFSELPDNLTYPVRYLFSQPKVQQAIIKKNS